MFPIICNILSLLQNVSWWGQKPNPFLLPGGNLFPQELFAVSDYSPSVRAPNCFKHYPDFPSEQLRESGGFHCPLHPLTLNSIAAIFRLSKEQSQTNTKGLGYFLFFGSSVHVELLPWVCWRKTLLSHTCGCCLQPCFSPRPAESSLNGALSHHLTIREGDDFYLVRNSRIGSLIATEQNNIHGDSRECLPCARHCTKCFTGIK